jgi:Iap family predicted aminopeptidase
MLAMFGQGGTPLRIRVTPRETVRHRLDLYKGNDKAREVALVQLFTEAGCSAAGLSEQTVPKRKQPNVICRVPGDTPRTIVIGAHFDHVPRGDGIIDNWSGAALLPSLLESGAGSSHAHTFVFVGFTGEEEGLVGSSYYVEHLTADELAQVDAMINLDTLALGPTKVWVSQSDPRLVRWLGLLAQTVHLPVGGVDGFGESDEESFIRQNICTFTVHSLTRETVHVLHRSDDNPVAVRFDDYYDTYHLLADYLALLDTQLTPDRTTCRARAIGPYGGRRIH